MEISISNNIYQKHVAVAAAKTIAAAHVSSRRDYFNALLYDTAKKDIVKLQHEM